MNDDEQQKYVPVDEVKESNFVLTEQDFILSNTDENQSSLPDERNQNALPADKALINEAFYQALDGDFRTARDNIIEVANKGEEVLDSMIALARMSDSPRAFEVVSTLMNTIVSANRDLVDLYDKKQKMDEKNTRNNNDDTAGNNNSYTQNNFYGTTKELQKALENVNNSDNNDAPTTF